MTAELVVKRAQAADAALVMEGSRVIHPGGSHFNLVEELSHPQSQLWIASVAESCVGYCLIRTVLEEAEILHIEVAKDWRQKGVGRALLHSALQEGNADVVFLEVREGNRAAIHLYETDGFAVVGRRENYYKEPTEDAILMKKPLRGV